MKSLNKTNLTRMFGWLVYSV